MAPSRVIEALKAAATGSPDVVHGNVAQAYACAFSDSLVDYELAFVIDSFALNPWREIGDAGTHSGRLSGLDIRIGAPAMDVRIIRPGDLGVTTGAPQSTGPSQPNES